MRKSAEQGHLRIRAISGTRVVLLAIDIAKEARAGLLGFAIGKVKSGKVEWLRGRKVFGSVVPAPKPEASFPSSEHPIQSLIWSDFGAAPATSTRYRVQPMYGSPAAPELRDGVEIDIATEDPTIGTHGIHFNRGAIASQAFSEHFQNKAPADEEDPKDPEVRWLARGMLDAALDFIARSKAGDGLRVAAYEFTYAPILRALKDASARGVDVQIVYEAGKEKDEKTGTLVDTSATTTARKAIQKLGLSGQFDLKLIKRTKRRKIPHNKFIVWLRGGQAREVLAGSANFTPSGFIGQTNVVHIVRDAKVAGTYLDYWTQLASDPETTNLSTWTEGSTSQSSLDAATAQPSITTYFSPRKNDDMLDWYAAQIGKAKDCVMFTAAFGVNKTLADQFGIDRDYMRFILLEDEPDQDLRAKLRNDRDVLAAYGSLLGAYVQGTRKFPKSSLDEWFLKEELFRKQGNIFFLHTKFLLIDPLSDDPLVMTGSANFSSSSLTGNDENMMLIRGDQSVADIYLTEFDRIFRHFFTRQTINRLVERGLPLTEAKFLDETSAWLDEYVKPGLMKTNRQRLFFPQWPARG